MPSFSKLSQPELPVQRQTAPWLANRSWTRAGDLQSPAPAGPPLRAALNHHSPFPA